MNIRSIDKAVAATHPSIAVVHDWCPSFRGGERVIAEICHEFPQADIYKLITFISEEFWKEFTTMFPFVKLFCNFIPKGTF